MSIIAVLLVIQCTIGVQSATKNVLFLVADDLRPDLGVYQPADSVQPPIITPNIDRLASQSLVLKRAYSQQAVCSPSRSSYMTGRRPDTTHVYDLQSYFREVGGNFSTIPQYFGENGYRSIGIGKIYHPGQASGVDDPPSWNEPYYQAPNNMNYSTKDLSWYSVTAEQIEEFPLPDELLVDHAISWFQSISEELPSERTPFFMALGLYKPHLPFVFPEEYLDYYPEESINLPENPYAPVNMPGIAWSSYGELREYQDIADLNVTGAINTTLPDSNVLAMRRAYLATISFVDTLIGKVLDALDQYGLANDTVISFVSDHGWQLGEHGEWCKHNNFELAAHTPMMVRIPGVTDDGIETDALTELVDLYPTLVEAAGLPQMEICPAVGAGDVHVCREGQSLLPLIDSPTGDTWKDRIFYQFERGTEENRKMGYSMRTDTYHYTEWVGFTGEPDYLPIWDDIYGRELYDHTVDPQENYNVVNDPQYSDVVPDLHDKLVAGWRAVVS